MDLILVRYGEIALKGANRRRFEKTLEENIRAFLKKEGISFKGVSSKRSRIFIYEPSSLPDLSKVLGIVSYSPAWEFASLREVKEFLAQQEEIFSKAASFRITASRADKNYPLTSPEIERELGAVVWEKFSVPVNLKEPEVNVGVEYIDEFFYVYFEKLPGWGGLPVGVSGKLVALLSGGIDSPVAAFLMMKRGAELILLHFQREPIQDRIGEIHKALSYFAAGREPELVVMDLGKVSRFYSAARRRDETHRYMCVLCKHMMLKTAEKLAFKKGALGIVTGDSLAQVASQTLENLAAQRYGLKLPVYSPLIGLDKTEIIAIAKKIGTYQPSIEHRERPCPLHPHPVTRARMDKFFKLWDEVVEKTGFLPWERFFGKK